MILSILNFKYMKPNNYKSCIQSIKLITKAYNSTTRKMYDKILIANRGEISIRIMKTCEKLGIKTVAIFSEADSNSLFVKRANEAICIGPPPSVDSYLNIDAIVDACKVTGAQAVHPGYGFLSENYLFAEKLENNNICFIGPSIGSLRLMGDKIQSKKFAASINVNIVPGFDGVVRDMEHVKDIAKHIGYPIMIKAAGGGGGKGMRIAYNENEVEEGYKLSVAEAKSSFNDDRILVEKFIEDPRHIEFQILGDKYGNVVHLNERECSIQRRNQKLLEEAPSCALTKESREIMGSQAVALAKNANYYSAGTVEFLVDKNKHFYFLEMNTRLQVEHPITECITGIDIVEQMIKIAAGEHLPFQQQDIPIIGWALENRINSENPYKNLGLPSIGRINKYNEPVHIKNVRIDSGIEEGSEISIFYDSLIAKLICHGKDRGAALSLSRKALDYFTIKGVNHNIALLIDIMDDKDFKSGQFNTKYLNIKYPDGFKGRQLNENETYQVITSVIFNYLKHMKRLWFGNKDNFIKSIQNKSYMIKLNNKHIYPIHFLEIVDSGNFKLTIGLQNNCHFNMVTNTPYYTEAFVNNKPVIFQKLFRDGNNYKVQLFGSCFDALLFTQDEYKYNEMVPKKSQDELVNVVVSPMQGVVVSVSVNPGQNISIGDEIAVVEAMKMHNTILSSKNGKIKTVYVKPQNTVNENDIIIEYEP